MSDGDDSTTDYSLRIHGRRFSRHGEEADRRSTYICFRPSLSLAFGAASVQSRCVTKHKKSRCALRSRNACRSLGAKA